MVSKSWKCLEYGLRVGLFLTLGIAFLSLLLLSDPEVDDMLKHHQWNIAKQQHQQHQHGGGGLGMSSSQQRRAHLVCDNNNDNNNNDNNSTTKKKKLLYEYNDEIVQQMVYWQDIPSDWKYTSPFYDKKYYVDTTTQPTKYLTFELDKGGWNNVRLELENVLAMAFMMGRTLVLPPSQEIYLLNYNNNKNDKNDKDKDNGWGLDRFFPLKEISKKLKGLEIITTQEFLERETFYDRQQSQSSQQSQQKIITHPPSNRTNWNGCSDEDLDELYYWFETSVHGFVKSTWNPEECMAAFAVSADPDDAISLQQRFDGIAEFPPKNNYYEKYIGHPTPVYASAYVRLMEQLNGRTKLCMYNNQGVQHQESQILHFHGGRKLENLHQGRLLVPFYAFLFFEDWKHDVWIKRFVRDQVRYTDEIQCAAARIVTAIRMQARTTTTTNDNDNDKNHNMNPQGFYDAFHVRRGEFQYKKTKISSSEMYTISKDEIPDGSTIYIATDELDKSFFDGLAKHHNLLFLDDFMYLLDGIDPIFYGMIEQLVTSQARVFFGCYFSTFSAYINRIRGYHTDMVKGKGFGQGIINSYYYAPPEYKLRMRKFWPVSGALYAREFPVGWRNIDQGISELAEEMV